MTIRPRLVGALARGGALLRERGVGAGVYLQAAARALRPLQSAESREAFLQTLRAVIDVHGQRVSATDRLYLLEALPTMIVWGERDNTIPLAHGRDAHEAIPHSHFRTLPAAAHFPHLEDPDGLSGLLREFMRTTQPGVIEDGDWGAILARRSLPSRRIGNAA
jgi:pimeloyl-ACP methyl ester carboxylesterase